mgnify:CR=1 FL=1
MHSLNPFFNGIEDYYWCGAVLKIKSGYVADAESIEIICIPIHKANHFWVSSTLLRVIINCWVVTQM